VFEAAGLGLHVHDVTGMRAGDVRPFDVVARSIIKPSSAAPTVVLTHFPILSFEERAREAGLLYSGHLNQLASVTGPTTMTGPIVVLSGHLHLRAVTVESEALQLCFAALVEAPYELALVELERADGGLDVSYRCASARPPDAEKLPVLDPAEGAWRWRPGAGWHQA
jgi:hypothetical protein